MKVPTLIQIRKAHRRMVGLALLFLTTAGITGLLWAYAPYLYWKDGYKQKKTSDPVVDLASAGLSHRDLVSRMKERFGPDAVPTEITLKSTAGWLIYQVRALKPGGVLQAGLLDAKSGEWLSPLNEESALRLAKPFVNQEVAVEDAVLLKNWIPRKQSKPRPTWRIRYQDPEQTEIFLDPDSGELLEDQDRVRKFHFFIMDLHQLNFFGFRKVLTVIPGALLLGMIVTGFFLWYLPEKKRKSATRSASSLIAQSFENENT